METISSPMTLPIMQATATTIMHVRMRSPLRASDGRAPSILRRVPNASDQQLSVGEAIPQDETGARNPGLPPSAVVEKDACARMDRQEIAQEGFDARRESLGSLNGTTLDEVVKLALQIGFGLPVEKPASHVDALAAAMRASIRRNTSSPGMPSPRSKRSSAASSSAFSAG